MTNRAARRAGAVATGDPELDRLVVCLGFALPVLLLAVVPAVQYPHWQWTAMVLATPVVTWGAWPLHRAAFGGLWRGRVAVQLPASLAVLATYGWSVWAMIGGGAGSVTHTHSADVFALHADGSAQILFEVAAGVATLALLGPYLATTAVRRAGVAQVQPIVDQPMGRAGSVLAVAATAFAAGTGGFWLGASATGGTAVATTAAVLAGAAPAAFALARTAALRAAGAAAARLGVLCGGPAVLRAGTVDTVVLDAPALRSGLPTVRAVELEAGSDLDDVLGVAAALALHSPHPTAAAIAPYAAARTAFWPSIGAVEVVGRDVHASTGARDVALTGGPEAVTVGWDGAVRAVIRLDHPPPAEAEIARLRALDVEPVLLTAADAGTVGPLAERAGITVVVPDARPEGKVEVIHRLQQDGRTVLMVAAAPGDGAALAAADLAIALESAEDVAGTTAAVIALLRRTAQVLQADAVALWLVAVVVLPLCAAQLVHPLLAAAAAALLTPLVVLDAQRVGVQSHSSS